jgi:large subunit ribosomal protein L9
MQVILQKDYEQLGKILEVVNVKDGFARNYLFPRGIAVPASEGNKRALEETRKMNGKKEEKRQRVAQEKARSLEKVPCTIKVKVGEEDRLFGSVTNQDIAEFLSREGYEIERQNIILEEPIKQLGVYTVTVKLYKDVSAQLKVWVVKEEG